jgi:GTPase
VAIVVCDASAGVTAEDLRVAEMAMRKKCATVLALNKWDVVGQAAGSAGRAAFASMTDLEDAKGRTSRKLRQRPQVMAVSAKTGRGLKRLVAEAVSLADRSAERIPTPELNRFLGDLQTLREPPAVRGKRLRMYYMSQFEASPPRFAIQVNDRARVTRDYAYFLENRLRERYGLQGVPLVIDFKTSRGRS